MKWIKRILVVFLVLVVLLVGFLVAAPYLFKDQIIAGVKESANAAVTAEVDFADVDVSFFRSFPEVAVTVEDVRVVGVDTFAGLPLMTAEEVTVDLGFWSVLGDDGYVIDAVELEKPFINLKVLSPELANYLIVPEDDSTPPASVDTTTAPAAAQINLEHFAIHDGRFIYDDRTTETYLEIKGLNTTGDGDFTASIFDLDTYSEAEELTLRQAGVAYLNRVKATADAVVNVDLDQSKYTFKDNKILLNALELVFGGSIQLAGDDILFDLEYSAPANDFRQVWSMIPSAYTTGFEDVKTTGTFTLAGTVNGPFNSVTETYPAFTVKSTIADGSVQYPGRPIGLDGIAAQLDVNSPSADLNRMKIALPRFAFRLGGDPFRGSFRLATPLTDPDVDLTLDGKIDLAKWAQAIPLEGVSELAGVIVADLKANGVRQSVLDAGNYAGVDLSGTVGITDLIYAADGLPAVRDLSAQAVFSPAAIDVSSFSAKMGRSDVAGSARITTPLAYFNPDQTMRGDVTLRSAYFDADEWMEDETAAVTSPAEMTAATLATPDATTETEIFDRFDFTVDAEIDRLQYDVYAPEDLKVRGHVKPNDLVIESMSARLGESDFAGNGDVRNLFDYTFGDGVLAGVLNLKSGNLQVSDFMTEETATDGTTSTSAESSEAAGSAAIPVPQNINLTVNMNADRVQYDDIELRSTGGQLLVQNGRIVIQDGTANLLGGSMKFAGAYDTSEPGAPGFRFHYDLQSLDFVQSFNVLNSFAALAPVGKFLRGNFSTDLVMEGKLGDDLFPKLETINAEGLFETAEARLAEFAPLRKIGDALNVEELRGNTTLRNIVTLFSVEDGAVNVSPFRVNLVGIPMDIQGKHSLTQDMDYTIAAAVPRSKIGGTAVGGAALGFLDKFSGEAGKLGVNLAVGDTINIGVGLTGNITNPKTSVKLLGTSGSGEGQTLGGTVKEAVTDAVDEQVEAAKERARQEAEARKAALEAQAQAELDRIKAEAANQTAAIRDSIERAAAAQAAKLKQEAERRLKLQLDSIAKANADKVVPPAVKQTADEVKDKLNQFNPFGKKKKKDGDGGR